MANGRRHTRVMALAAVTAHVSMIAAQVLPTLQESLVTEAPDTVSGDRFGASFAAAADRSVGFVGAPGKSVGGLTGRGAVYAVRPTSAAGAQTVTVAFSNLTVTNGAAGDAFGSSVAVSANGTVVVVGAPTKTVSTLTNAGAAYIFNRAAAPGEYGQAAFLFATDVAQNANFGAVVSISSAGTTVAVGAPGRMSRQGTVYVFMRAASAWSQAALLTASDAAFGNGFGVVSLSPDGGVIAVGAPGRGSRAGAVYLFTWDSNAWSECAIVSASDAAPDAQLGTSVTLSAGGNVLLAGAPGTASAAGAAYVFARGANNTWTQREKLSAPDAASSAGFGAAAWLQPDAALAIVSAPNKTVAVNASQGGVYVFTAPANANFSLCAAPVHAREGASNDGFGSAVSVYGTAASGMLGVTAPQRRSGAGVLVTFDITCGAATPSPTATPSPSTSSTPSPSASSTPSPSGTTTPTPSASASVTATPSATPSVTPTATPSPSRVSGGAPASSSASTAASPSSVASPSTVASASRTAVVAPASTLPSLPARSPSASKSVGATASPSTTPLLASASVLPSVDPRNASAYVVVSFDYVILGARPGEVLSPFVIANISAAIAQALRVPVANVIVTGYIDRSAGSRLLLRMLQAGGGALATVLTFGVRTTPDTTSAAAVMATLTNMPANVAAAIESVAVAVLAATTGRAASLFNAATDVASVSAAPLAVPPSASASPLGSVPAVGASASSLTPGQIAGAVIGAVAGAALITAAVAVVFVYMRAPSRAVAPRDEASEKTSGALGGAAQGQSVRHTTIMVGGEQQVGYENLAFAGGAAGGRSPAVTAQFAAQQRRQA